jgi:hypothetical protein
MRGRFAEEVVFWVLEDGVLTVFRCTPGLDCEFQALYLTREVAQDPFVRMLTTRPELDLLLHSVIIDPQNYQHTSHLDFIESATGQRYRIVINVELAAGFQIGLAFHRPDRFTSEHNAEARAIHADIATLLRETFANDILNNNWPQRRALPQAHEYEPIRACRDALRRAKPAVGLSKYGDLPLAAATHELESALNAAKGLVSGQAELQRRLLDVIHLFWQGRRKQARATFKEIKDSCRRDTHGPSAKGALDRALVNCVESRMNFDQMRSALQMGKASVKAKEYRNRYLIFANLAWEEAAISWCPLLQARVHGYFEAALDAVGLSDMAGVCKPSLPVTAHNSANILDSAIDELFWTAIHVHECEQSPEAQ